MKKEFSREHKLFVLVSMFFCMVCVSLKSFAQQKVNGHEVVDLGLSVKWATCNIGATLPEQYGDYYTWGGVESRKRDRFFVAKEIPAHQDAEGYDVPAQDVRIYTKYALNQYWYNQTMKQQVVDNLVELQPQDDVATKKWGKGFRMPTSQELNELLQKCEFYSVTKGGVEGLKVVGPNGKSIFIPLAGGFKGTGKIGQETLSKFGQGEIFGFWSSNLTDDPSGRKENLGANIQALGLFLMGSGDLRPYVSYQDRAKCASVRAVYESDEDIQKKEEARLKAAEEAKAAAKAAELAKQREEEARLKAEEEAKVKLVDLGLSVKWADRNVGARSESEVGEFFSNGGQKTIIEDGMCIPSVDNYKELFNKCKWSTESINGTMCFKVVGPNGNSILLPAAGFYGLPTDFKSVMNGAGEGFYEGGECGYYITTSLYASFVDCATITEGKRKIRMQKLTNSYSVRCVEKR